MLALPDSAERNLTNWVEARSSSGGLGHVEGHSEFAFGRNHATVEARRHPRYKLEVDVRIYPRNSAVVRGHSVDISESGISALLRVEVPMGEVVRLEFAVPIGDIEVQALVRQRSAFRYGFQFLEAISQLEIIHWAHLRQRRIRSNSRPLVGLVRFRPRNLVHRDNLAAVSMVKMMV